MIIAVDDDEVMLEVIQATLDDAGFTVKGFSSPHDALLFMDTVAPALIVSDVLMPEMDGFAFRNAYQQIYPARNTPFLFLSSVSDPDIIVEGLEQGAADYLVKPIDHRILAAKVRSILKRKTVAEDIFHGDLTKFPLSRVMKFCELKGITGRVEIVGEGVNVGLDCRGGNFELDGQADSSQFEEAFELTSGSFTIRALPVDYSEIHHAQVAPSASSTATQSQDLPMGKLSGVKVNQRMFQVQSEFVEQPQQQVLTMVILDGKVVMKKGTPAQLSLGREALQQIIEEQHAVVEREVHEKIIKRIAAKGTLEVTQKESFNQMFEDGWECYREGNYSKALALWEEAQRINTNDKTIEINLKIVRKKLASIA
jgi:DNA-binding response OmpR family regulator